jgi:hypothetical protein
VPGPASLFASISGGLYSFTLSNPSTPTLLSTITYSSGIAYGGGKVYWENGTDVMACDPSACVPTPFAVQPYIGGSTFSGPMIADDVDLFWVAGGMHETNLATGVDAVIANVTGQYANELALDADNVYWANNTGIYWAPR